MKIGILAIGDELISGMTQDTNSSFMARELSAEGWQISGILIVGDDGQLIEKGLAHLMGISDAIIVTGGLGPTSDDMTTESIAKAFGLTLYTDEAILSRMKEGFRAFGLPWADTNTKQARFPEGAVIIDNPVGTACGFSLERGGVIIAVIPGVPREVHRMLPEGVVPLLRKTFGETGETRRRRTIKSFGLTEAEVAKRLSDLDIGPGIEIGFYPRFPENHIVVTARGGSEKEVDERLGRIEEGIVERLGKYVFGYDDDTMEGIVASILTKRNMTLAVAESCTGGLITDRITNVPGSSAFLERGVVVYSNRAKTELLGVPPEVIETEGAVSETTALLMATGVRDLAKADVGLAVTGIAGPTGGTEGKPVGTVFIALANDTGSFCRELHFRWDRRRNKEMTAQIALELLRRSLVGIDIHG
ncbi:MAG: competence/damage-inducible protein A [Deltaproteobacteria bacterium]|nr:competence/damage-inducible protein A [Deltaproteobacteria bacterium]MBN2845086.1 competence/damage-inducible protein A [Deltaproteobacteria bacterium]